MARVELPYGRRSISVEIPEENLIGVLDGAPTPVRSLEDAFAEGWENPIGTDDPVAILRGSGSVVFVVTDQTRPTPTGRLLTLIWNRVGSFLKKENVTLLVATGTHRPPTEEELDAMLGPWRDRLRVVIHDCDRDCVEVGMTSGGNKVSLHRLVAEADHVVTIGHIGMHYYAGYSGGRKNILPGVAERGTIERNHALFDHPKSAPCVYGGNPISDEMVEASAMIHHDLIVNVVLGPDGAVAKVIVGEPEAAHAVGRAFWNERFQVPFRERADLVIASAGGHPKDINLYQAHKGEYNAALAVRDGGLLFLAAACTNGVGHAVFEAWIRESESPDDVLGRFEREGFRLGAHKALYLAKDRKRIDLALRSELDDDLVRRAFMHPMHDPSEAFDLARKRFGDAVRVLVMPHAAATLPVLDVV